MVWLLFVTHKLGRLLRLVWSNTDPKLNYKTVTILSSVFKLKVPIDILFLYWLSFVWLGKVMSTKEFGTLYSMDVHPTKPWWVDSLNLSDDRITMIRRYDVQHPLLLSLQCRICNRSFQGAGLHLELSEKGWQLASRARTIMEVHI